MRHLLFRWTTLAGVAVVLVAALGIAYWAGWLGGDNGEPAANEPQGIATVETAEAKPGSLSPIALAYGTVASSPQHTFVIALMRDGVFKSVAVHDGDAVRAGQAIVTVTSAPANTAAYAQARSAFDFATQDLARLQRLFANKLATNDQLATARRAVADAQAQWDAQRQIGAGAAEEVLRAPFDGVVTGLMAVPGDKVQANTAIAVLASRSDVVVQLNLEPEDAAKLMPGAAVRLTPSFQGAKDIAGKLISVGANVDPATRLVKAVAEISAADAGVTPLTLGATMVAHIDLPAQTGIVIPRAALLEDAGGPYLFSISKGAAHKQTVKIVAETDDMALIDKLDPALGARIVVSGNAELDDGTPVREGKP